jgi:hypothetical protein
VLKFLKQKSTPRPGRSYLRCRESLATFEVGKIANIEGAALVTPKAPRDLLSMMEMIKSIDGRFLGESKTIPYWMVKTISFFVPIIAKMTTGHVDLIGNARVFKGDSALGETDPNEDRYEEADQNESQTLIHLDQQPHT